MKRFAAVLIALVSALSSFNTAHAFPTARAVSKLDSPKLVEKIQWDSDRRWRPHGERWRGHFRYRPYRDHYYDRRPWRHRHHSNAGAILGGLAAGALIGGAIAQSQQPRYERPAPQAVSGDHVRWCYNRYRSYRAFDNTFQPYYGDRQQCYSPY